MGLLWYFCTFLSVLTIRVFSRNIRRWLTLNGITNITLLALTLNISVFENEFADPLRYNGAPSFGKRRTEKNTFVFWHLERIDCRTCFPGKSVKLTIVTIDNRRYVLIRFKRLVSLCSAYVTSCCHLSVGRVRNSSKNVHNSRSHRARKNALDFVFLQ